MVCVMALHSARLRMWAQTILSSHWGGALTGLDLFCEPGLYATLAVPPEQNLNVLFGEHLSPFLLHTDLFFFVCVCVCARASEENLIQQAMSRFFWKDVCRTPPPRPYAPSELRTHLTSELESNPTKTCDITLAAFATYVPWISPQSVLINFHFFF